MTWENKLQLNEGESLRFEGKREKGHLGQEEIARYSIICKDGQLVGSVQITDYMPIKVPFRRSHHLVHRDIQGVLIYEERWIG